MIEQQAAILFLVILAVIGLFALGMLIWIIVISSIERKRENDDNRK